ncbi:hypothetical protein AB0C52_06755 [Streptomyces sp. NPDC048717]|uniref:hypothetical protein n=1 Tax=Streptomyces sp. NPDC048717 TaxID=3154928 RepID=UPI003443ED8F
MMNTLSTTPTPSTTLSRRRRCAPPSPGDRELAAEQFERRRFRMELNAKALEPARWQCPDVLLYVKTLPGQDPGALFRSLRNAAERWGWRVTDEVHDDTGIVDPQHPDSRWRSVEARLRHAEADGVLAVHERHISMDPYWYRRALTRVAGSGRFTALLYPEDWRARSVREAITLESP